MKTWGSVCKSLFLGLLALLLTFESLSAELADIRVSRQMAGEVAKTASSDNSYRWRFIMRLRNFSENAVEVQLEDDLADQFPGVETITVTNLKLLDDPLNLVDHDQNGISDVVTNLAVNDAFDGDSVINLLQPGQQLAAGSAAIISYNIEVDFSSLFGPFESQVTAVNLTDPLQPVYSLSNPGEQTSGEAAPDGVINQEEPAPTIVFIPANSIYSPLSCSSADNIVNHFNHIANGGFTQEHASPASGHLANPLIAGTTLANSFKSDGRYRGDHAAPLGGGEIAIKSDVTAFGRTQLQYHFPGDTENQVAPAAAYLLTRGTFPTASPQRVWYQKLAGLDPDASYIFSAYVSNTAWIDLDVEDPIVQLTRNGEPISGTAITLAEEATSSADAGNDRWKLLETEISPDADGSVTLGVANLLKDERFHDSKFALTAIQLRKCVSADSQGLDPDNTSYPFATEDGNTTDSATSNPVQEVNDPVEDGDGGVIGTGGGGSSHLLWLFALICLRIRNFRFIHAKTE